MLPETLPDIADADLERFYQIMLARYGYDFRGYAPASLKRRLGTVIKRYGLRDMQALNQRLLMQPDYFERFINEITVSTTEFFRDPSAWRALRLQVLPHFLAQPQIRVWHAGCSTGEEVLSMAILLKEVGLYEKAQLFATDIDVRSLEVAEKAHYPLRYKSLYEQNLQGVLPGVPLHRYAKEEAGQLIFDPVLLKNVRFLRHNLVSEGVFGRFDIVLCRNVLIYFTPPLQEQVVAKLVESLVEGGVLMIGTKESLFWCSSAKKLVAVNETERIYRKKA